jgi:ElaB/YqjD/DUF883 family membrane-anchored ribosome-binding protein
MSTTAKDATTKTSTNSGTGSTSSTGSSSSRSGGTTGSSSRAADAYSAARERTSSAYGSARETASRATQRTSQQIESNPVVAVLGGLAVGGLLAWVLPKTQRETQALGSVGTKLTDTAKQAAQTALDAGKQQVNEIKENAATKVGQAVMDAVAATTTSATSGSTSGSGSAQ